MTEDQDTPMTDSMLDIISTLPGYTGRGVKLITDCFTHELIRELLALPKEAQVEFWFGVYFSVCANIKGATRGPEVLEAIKAAYERQR